MVSGMWYEDEYSNSVPESDTGGLDSDAVDSETESFLYSAVHYNTEEKCTAPKTPPVVEVGCAAPKAHPVAAESDDYGVTSFESVPPKKRKAHIVQQARNAKPEDCEVIVLSSDDDEVIVCEEEGQQNLVLTLVVPRIRGVASDLWYVDAEYVYRNSRGFRYYNSEKAHCRKSSVVYGAREKLPRPQGPLSGDSPSARLWPLVRASEKKTACLRLPYI
ncbi:hypothetical protein HPB51_027161 [Rhipicephalus microplus]|uniref:Uncharacterized protein n=1 Tax=Rhipicephalus microplus TaxID=6941 RepID=A0A9J6D177_RHIMP|nr:hypothetical protein HPB51_027161 [Rhipicephalus microplus]